MPERRPLLSRGPGAYANPELPREQWGGRKAQQWVAKVLAEYGTICWLCGLPGANSADHVIPRDNGGAVYDMANLAPSHRSCNYARGKRPAGGAGHIIESGLAFFSSS